MWSVLAWMCVHLYMCVHICGGHRSSSGSDPQKLYSFLRQAFSLSWSSPSMLSWLASEPQGQAVFASPPSSGITHLRNRLVSRRVLMELLPYTPIHHWSISLRPSTWLLEPTELEENSLQSVNCCFLQVSSLDNRTNLQALERNLCFSSSATSFFQHCK